MSLACLKDWIGVQGCTTTTPDSGLFINQLPGIELEMIDGLADEQQVDFNGVWDDVQERAVRRLKTDINAEFKKRYLLKNITQSIDTGAESAWADVGVLRTAAAEYRGVSLTLNRQDDNFAYSNLQTIYVQQIGVYFTSLNATTIKVFDIDTGVELFSKAVAAPAATGMNYIDINQTFEAREVVVVYDATLLDSITYDLTTLKAAINRSQNGCSYSTFDCGGGNHNAELRGMYVGVSDPLTSIVFGDNSFGLTIKWSVICSFDQFVCNNKESFTRALWLLLGVELMMERQYTSRLNEFTAFDRNKAVDLWKKFEIEYRGGTLDDIEYEGELFMAIDAINLDLSDYCLVCNDEVRTEEMI